MDLTEYLVTRDTVEIDHTATGQRLRSLRERRGVSLRSQADTMGISPPYLSDLERGNRHWNAQLVERFLHAIPPQESE